MARVNVLGYVERNRKKGGRKEGNYRNWWLVTASRLKGNINLGNVSFPKKYIGKRVRLKVEVLE